MRIKFENGRVGTTDAIGYGDFGVYVTKTYGKGFEVPPKIMAKICYMQDNMLCIFYMKPRWRSMLKKALKNSK